MRWNLLRNPDGSWILELIGDTSAHRFAIGGIDDVRTVTAMFAESVKAKEPMNGHGSKIEPQIDGLRAARLKARRVDVES